MNSNPPTTTTPIIHIRTRGDLYRSLWLKYVRFVDLQVHCINSLGGERHRRIFAGQRTQTLMLNEHRAAPAYYLCGVTHPYVWTDNAHLLALPAPGEVHDYETARLSITVENLRPFVITPDAIDPDDPHFGDRNFQTCRNWQAAWWLHGALALPNHPNPERFRYARSRSRSYSGGRADEGPRQQSML